MWLRVVAGELLAFIMVMLSRCVYPSLRYCTVILIPVVLLAMHWDIIAQIPLLNPAPAALLFPLFHITYLPQKHRISTLASSSPPQFAPYASVIWQAGSRYPMDARMVSTFVYLWQCHLLIAHSYVWGTNAHKVYVRDKQWWIVRRIEFVATLDDIRKNESGATHHFDKEVKCHIYHS